jgi:hypothetical protein
LGDHWQTEAVVGIVGAGAAILGGLLTGFYESAQNWWTRPKLAIEYTNGPANRVQATWEENQKPVDWVIVRAGIRNKGKRPATNCRTLLIDLQEIHDNSGHHRADSFDSMPLPWAGWDFTSRTLPPPKEIVFYVDLVRVRKDTPGWQFTFNKPLASLAKLEHFHKYCIVELLAKSARHGVCRSPAMMICAVNFLPLMIAARVRSLYCPGVLA